MNRMVLTAVVAATLSTVDQGMLAQDVGFFPGTTYKIVQLTGDKDYSRRVPTLSRTQSRFCASGTDLGSTFEHNGRLYFLFGDTPGGEHDFLAWTDSSTSRPEDVLLTPHMDGNCFHPIAVPGVRLAGLEVPSYGISVGGRIYVVVTTDASYNPDMMGRSVMAVSDDNGRSFQNLYDLSTSNFINVSMVEVDGRDYPGVLPAQRCVLIWGSGPYHLSDVRLAYVPSAQITNKSAIQYLGLPGAAPLWNPNEAAAVPLFSPSEPTVGEFSVQYCTQLRQWLMLYNARAFEPAPPGMVVPEGIHLRSASQPWGPWSQPISILDGFPANKDHAFRQYIHQTPDPNGEKYDVIEDQPYKPGEFGILYGPYMIPRFFRGNENRVTIVYTVSTWNPYQAILIQSDIGYPDRVQENITSSTTLPGDSGWIVFPTNLLHGSLGPGNGPHVTTFGDNGDADVGVAQYGFMVGCSDLALEFTVHGGDGEVVLIEQTQVPPSNPANMVQFYTDLKDTQLYGPVVETVIGPQSIASGHGITVRWDLRRHRGKMMRLLVIDKLTQPWGFISVSQVTRFFVTGEEPVNIYVNGANTSGPFLGVPTYPFRTVTTGYHAATDSTCSTNVLKIHTGTYPETITMDKPVTLNAEGGAATIGF